MTRNFIIQFIPVQQFQLCFLNLSLFIFLEFITVFLYKSWCNHYVWQISLLLLLIGSVLNEEKCLRHSKIKLKPTKTTGIVSISSTTLSNVSPQPHTHVLFLSLPLCLFSLTHTNTSTHTLQFISCSRTTLGQVILWRPRNTCQFGAQY